MAPRKGPLPVAGGGVTYYDEMVRWFAYLALEQKLGRGQIEGCGYHPMYPLGAAGNRQGLERIRALARPAGTAVG